MGVGDMPLSDDVQWLRSNALKRGKHYVNIFSPLLGIDLCFKGFAGGWIARLRVRAPH